MIWKPCPRSTSSRLPLIAGVAWLCIAGCLSTSYNLATNRLETTFTSDAREARVGAAIAKAVEEQLKPVEDATLQERVRTIGDRLAAVCDRREMLYHVKVLQDPKEAREPVVNAFSLPGGYVYVQQGLLTIVQTDDELAAVVAHEIGHITARHAVKRYEASLGATLTQLLALGAVRDAQFQQGLNVAMGQVFLAYAREDELEADRLSVKYLRAAGYHPEAILAVLEKLQAFHRKEPPRAMGAPLVRPDYAMTHPYVADRLRTVKETLYGRSGFVDYINKSE